MKDHSAAHFATQSQETLQLLGKYINLYQIHSATLEVRSRVNLIYKRRESGY